MSKTKIECTDEALADEVRRRLARTDITDAQLVNELRRRIGHLDHHKGEPFDLKRAFTVVENLAEAREALWGRMEADTPPIEPEDLAEMFHEATRKHDVGLREWAACPDWARTRDVAIAADVIARLRGGS